MSFNLVSQTYAWMILDLSAERLSMHMPLVFSHSNDLILFGTDTSAEPFFKATLASSRDLGIAFANLVLLDFNKVAMTSKRSAAISES